MIMASKEMIYLQGYSQSAQMWELMRAIQYGAEMHAGQTRKSGEPYFDHPVRVCSSLVALGIKEEPVLVAAVLHDILEDCDIKPHMLGFIISAKTVHSIERLSKGVKYDNDRYYEMIKMDPVATLVKIADRCHNMSTMAGAFSPEKMRKYVVETRDYVIPLCKHGRRHHPEYSNAIISMKYQLESLCNTVEGLLSLVDHSHTEVVTLK